jgi:holo-[acyl-carrier protein] synthase
MILGIGVDVVDIARLETALERTPGLRDRLFTEAEKGLPVRSLAARFAAKEAIAKSLGAPGNLRWHDVTVHRTVGGPPRIDASGTVAARAAELGVRTWHITISHDAGIASAMVIAEG